MPQTSPALRPLWLFRRWKDAAGNIAGSYIPSAPFTALQEFGMPATQATFASPLAQIDVLGARLAAKLVDGEMGEAVRQGEAALVLDFPATVSLAMGYHLQNYGINPALCFGGLYRAGAILEGNEALPALAHYGEKIKPGVPGKGLAFLFERERTGTSDLTDFDLLHIFDNRYHAGSYLLPPLPTLVDASLQALVDVRPATDTLPNDLDFMYREAASLGLEILQVTIPLDWLAD